MTEHSSNVILDKSYRFAVRVVKMYQHLSKEKREFILSKQVLRSRTSIGANVEEAAGGLSRKDFVARMNIAYREARETAYWLRLLRDTGYVESSPYSSMASDCDELLRLLFAIVRTTRKNLDK